PLPYPGSLAGADEVILHAEGDPADEVLRVGQARDRQHDRDTSPTITTPPPSQRPPPVPDASLPSPSSAARPEPPPPLNERQTVAIPPGRHCPASGSTALRSAASHPAVSRSAVSGQSTHGT